MLQFPAFNPFSRSSMRRLLRILGFSGGLCFFLLLAAGCNQRNRSGSISETDDPHYRQGERLKRQGHYQQALGAFLKVIDKYGDNAPESHLEAGLLYLHHLKDPLAALYNFRRYLELRPRSRQADHVRGQITLATREFARTLPAQPFENQTARLELLEQIDQLRKENLTLKEEIAALRAGRSVPVPTASASISLNSEGSAPAPAASAGASHPPRSLTPATPASAAAPPGAGKRHVVAPGDTLMGIARRYYGSDSKFRDIREANRDVLGPGDSPTLKPGMVLRIP